MHVHGSALFWEANSDPHHSRISRALEVQNGAVEGLDAHNGGVEAFNGALKRLLTSGRRLASRVSDPDPDPYPDPDPHGSALI